MVPVPVPKKKPPTEDADIIELDDEATGYVRYGFDKKQVDQAVLQEQQRLDSQLNSVLSALVVVAILGLLLGTLGSSRLAHKISGPLHEVVDTVKDIAEGEGDLTKRIESSGAGEIGELAMWFNTFLNHLQELIRGVGDTTMNLADASGNLTDTSASMTENAATTSEQASQWVKKVNMLLSLIFCFIFIVRNWFNREGM